MKEFILNKYRIISVSFIAALSLTSCSDSDSTIEDMDISGEWLQDASYDNKVVSAIQMYRNGTYKAENVRMDIEDRVFETQSGSYTISGNSLTRDITSSIYGKALDEITIKQVTDYSLTLYTKAASSTEVLYRIVDTYNMKVGETRIVIIADSDFKPTSYQSNYNYVASVDNSGIITAEKRGTAYIIVSSSSSEKAVIRVKVTDSDNAIDNYYFYLGAKTSAIKDVLGTPHYDFNPTDDDPFISYWLFDDYFSAVTFNYKKSARVSWYGYNVADVVYHILVDVKENVNNNTISQSLNSYFQYLGNDGTTEIYGIISNVFTEYGLIQFDVYVYWFTKEKIISYMIDSNELYSKQYFINSSKNKLTKKIVTQWGM